jgi:hypothetical protein
VGLRGTRATVAQEVARVPGIIKAKIKPMNKAKPKAGSHLSAKTFKFGRVEKERVAKGVCGGVNNLKRIACFVGLFGTRATASHEVAKVAKVPREMNERSRNQKAGSHLSAKTFKFGRVEKERVAKGVFGGVITTGTRATVSHKVTKSQNNKSKNKTNELSHTKSWKPFISKNF